MSQDQANDRTKPQTVDVVVVGAGMAGLIAARELRRRGIDVIVLESASRPGGRTMAETTVLGSRVDVGGQWLGHGHHRFEALAAELGTTTYAMRTPKQPVIIDGDSTVGYTDPAVLIAIATLVSWEVMSRVGAPPSWKNLSVDSWLRRVPNRKARRILEAIVLVATTADLDRTSIHSLLKMIRYQGGLTTMVSTAGGAQDKLLVEGAGTLAERLAAELEGRVVFDSPVTALHRDDAGVTVHSATGSYRAAKVIVTVPPPMATRIEHSPALPADRISLQDNTYMGSVYKAIAIYDSPFWRARGHAELISLTEPAMAVFDTSPPDGPGHLCVLIAGPEARALDKLSETDRRAKILGLLAARLGTGVLEPKGWHEKAWHLDNHAGGGYLALPTVEHTDGYFPTTIQPTGHIHWAGTETASEHAGYIEGAIESGERVAREIVNAFTNRSL